MRYTGPSCRQCRREVTKLFLKGTKCFTEKCPVERRAYAPGQHGQATARRRKSSEYSKQLREKQKIKRIYGISEQQFRNTFEKVTTLPGITGHNLLAALESRLDNMIYRMGFAASRKAARQLQPWAKRGVPSFLLLFDNTNSLGIYIDPYAMKAGMYGLDGFLFSRPQNASRREPVDRLAGR